VPQHIAIIMDGNGRWATSRHLPRSLGHPAGVEALRRVVRLCDAYRIPMLTVYAFSTENWSRPEDEVAGLMEMFAELIVSETPELDGEGVRMRFVGSRRGVSDRLLEQMDWAEAETRANTRLLLFVAFNYGGRAEILDAAARYEGGGEDAFAKLLYAPDMSDPELVIRTSGEQRLSNFLLWQSAYSELHFSDCLWPDFDRAELERALREYGSRRRRFGARDSDR